MCLQDSPFTSRFFSHVSRTRFARIARASRTLTLPLHHPTTTILMFVQPASPSSSRCHLSV